MYPRVIAITGMKRSGKDTIADYLVTRHGYKKLSVSTPIKQICKIVFDFTDEQLETDSKDVVDERWCIAPRQAMQFIGTEVFQYKINDLVNVGKELWLKKIITQIDQCNNANNNVVISDIRFHHEYNALKDLYKDDCVIIQICREKVRENDSHPSEQEWNTFPPDYIIHNDDTMTHLYDQIENLFCKIQ